MKLSNKQLSSYVRILKDCFILQRRQRESFKIYITKRGAYKKDLEGTNFFVLPAIIREF